MKMDSFIVRFDRDEEAALQTATISPDLIELDYNDGKVLRTLYLSFGEWADLCRVVDSYKLLALHLEEAA